jgi:hypothetical protein
LLATGVSADLGEDVELDMTEENDEDKVALLQEKYVPEEEELCVV